MDWLDLLAVQGTVKSLLQHHSSKASIFRCSASFTVQFSHPYMTTGETTALTRQTFVGKVMSLLSWLVITFLPRSKCLLISWLQLPSAVILEPKKIKSDTASTVTYKKRIKQYFQCFIYQALIWHWFWASLVAQKVKICLQGRRPRFSLWVGKTPWRTEWLATPVFLPK